MMLEYTNEYNGSFLSCGKLKEISTVLKEGRTIQSRVMNFILTIISYIVLKIDDRSRLHEFTDIFDDRYLQILKNDLENLMHFKTKFFNLLILELLLETVKKENNYRNRRLKLNAAVDTANKGYSKVVLQKKVKVIVKFLIFRKVKTSSYLYDENNTFNWFSYKQKISVVLNNEISPKENFLTIKNNLKDYCEKNIMNCIFYKRKNECTNNVKNLTNYTNKEPRFYETFMYYTCISDLCTKFYWLLWYGWLAICMYYCCKHFLPDVLRCCISINQ